MAHTHGSNTVHQEVSTDTLGGAVLATWRLRSDVCRDGLLVALRMVAAAAFAGLVTDLSRLGLSAATADALALHAQQNGMPLDGARARASQVLFGTK